MDPMRVRWFGESWGAPICDPDYHIPTPVGEACGWCDEVFVDGDAGVSMLNGSTGGRIAFHVECNLRQVIGSVGHIQGWCSCYGGSKEAELDPEAMTKRQAAKAAVALWQQKQRQDGLNLGGE